MDTFRRLKIAADSKGDVLLLDCVRWRATDPIDYSAKAEDIMKEMLRSVPGISTPPCVGMCV